MSPILQLILLTTAAGATVPLGGLMACVQRVQPRWLEREFRHSVIAFGGGLLLAAVSLVLVPEGIHAVPLWVGILAMIAGGLAFMYLDRYLANHGGTAAQFVALLADYLPEALAMGAAFAVGKATGLVLAFVIAAQNLPEGFNAFREMAAGGRFSNSRILVLLAAAVPLGPLFALAGFFWLGDSPQIVACVMLFAAAGILYLTFQDIAPQAKLERHWGPPLGAVAGFLCGLCGQVLLG